MAMNPAAMAVAQEIADAIRKRHSYEVPQVIANPLIEIEPHYRAWLDNEIDH